MASRPLRIPALLVLACAGLTAHLAYPSASATAQAPAPTPAPAPNPSPAPNPNPPNPAPAPAPNPNPNPNPNPPNPVPKPPPAPDQDQVPIINSLSPASGPVGTQVVLTGTNLAGASEVDFGNSKALFAVSSATEVRATVPADVELGPESVVVITPAGAAVSPAPFTVTAK